MAYSKQAVVSTGGLAYMPITISYMFRDEIRVFFDDVPAVDGTWAWVGAHDAAITFSPAIDAGVTVRVQRFTRLGAMDHDFSDGAQFLAQNLDDNYNQLLHSLQEVAESGLSGLPAEGGIAGVSSFNGRAGAILLNSADVIGALGYTPSGGSVNVTTFNGRDGDVSLTVGDVTALGFVVGGGGGGVSTVANIAALRTAASVGGTTISTRGYYASGDGGASSYYLDSADTTTADNGGEVIVSTDGGRWKLAKGPVYSAKQFGARGNSSYSVPGADDTVALQRFINYISKYGARGHIPAGRYRCTNMLNLAENCSITGDGWKDVRDMLPDNSRNWALSSVIGTIIYADFMSSMAPAQMYVTGNDVTIRDIEFEVNQTLPSDSAWTPANVPMAVYAFRGPYAEQGGNTLTMDNIMLRNHNNGIKLLGVARGFLNNIYGQCFETAIDVTKNGDVLRLNNVHIGWSFYTGRAGTLAYAMSHLQAIVFGRVDNPEISNIFVISGQIGIKLYIDNTGVDQQGGTQRLQATNIGLDNMGIGIYMSDACNASFSNLYVYANDAVTDSRCIYGVAVLGGGQVPQNLQFVNCDFQGSRAEAVRLEVQGKVNMTNVHIRDYNRSGGSFPGIAVYDGMTLQYANLSVDTMSSTPLTQANGTGVISGGAGGGGGVSAFNTRTGPVTLLSSDVTTAFTSVPRLFSQAGTFRATGETTPASGTGLELNYSTTFSSSFLNSYDRTANAYKDLSIGGNNIAFKTSAAGNSATIDSAGLLHLTYQPATSDNSDKAVTSAWVRSYIAAGGSGLVSFQGRTTAAAVLTGGDVTGALGYTPVNQTNPSTSGLFGHNGTARCTSASAPGSGVGLELSYNAGGYVNAYNRGTNTYTDLTLGGAAVLFVNNGGYVAQFNSSGEMQIGSTTDQGAYKLQVNGQIWATSATIATSDRRLKENISNLGDATSIVRSLRAVTYDFKEHDTLDLPKGRQIGVIAQEVQQALAGTEYSESIVSTTGPYLGVAEVKLVPLLLKALQEALLRIEALERK